MRTDPLEITPDEIMVFCMARQINDGDVVAQGLATPLVAAAYLLARMTHAPNLYFASAIGQGICRSPARLSLVHVERLWLDLALNNAGFTRAVTEVLPRLKPKEFFRPAQIDPWGNFNNIAFGRDYQKPRLRLPGTGGIPDVTTYLDDIYLYIPRHSRVTFVRQIDFLSGLGHHPKRSRGRGARYLVTDMGQFDFVPDQESLSPPTQARMRLTTYHPGSTIERIQAKTGFEILVSPDVHETSLPKKEELQLLRKEIDPLGIRRLELLSGAERRDLLRTIISRETITSLT